MKQILGRLLSFSVLLGLGALPSLAVDRVVSSDLPAETQPDSPLRVTVQASSNVAGGEYVGFFHAEYSIDGGQNWTGICYEAKSGTKVERGVTITTGKVGTKVVVRARTAFRGGMAGDVDYDGGAINWDDTWSMWRTPPTRYWIAYVR
ncbi:MAG: hypothetical protein K9M98_03800 [Cephaloticoccus sp.]|nr:hypothetical protein [Cephaloticoccus sp.]MCF7759606.1 hypothetical protein [Cephaloticoccus sp.]